MKFLPPSHFAAVTPGRLAGAVLAGVLVLCGLGLAGMSRSDDLMLQQVVHWQDASHDWLLVADTESDEVVVYDATNGRPLRRLGSRDGLADVDGLVQQGTWLFVMGREQPNVQVLSLPQLQPQTLASR